MKQDSNGHGLVRLRTKANGASAWSLASLLMCGAAVAAMTGCSQSGQAPSEAPRSDVSSGGGGNQETAASATTDWRIVPDVDASEASDTNDDSSWDPLGRPQGDHSALQPLVGYNQFWFAWSVFNHGSAIFNRSNAVQTAPIEGEKECAVPCDEINLGCPGKDCIPALTAPKVVPANHEDADYIDDDTPVVGVLNNGEARAYPHNILWWHEIVNDRVGGDPVAVTHCPLTFSTIGHDPTQFAGGETVELGVSGRLYNSNLIFYNRANDAWYSQLLGKRTKGGELGVAAPRVPVYEMSWKAWREYNPDTTVLTQDTGHARDYSAYPYGDYFTDHDNTFSTPNPKPDPTYPNKTITYGLTVNGEAKAYAYPELRSWAEQEYGSDAPPRGVINDELGGQAVAIVFDLDARYVQAFDRNGLGNLTVTEDER